MKQAIQSNQQFFLFATALVVVVFCSAPLKAQSNFDLQAPLQADLQSQQVIMSPDPAAIPTFKFAVAGIGEDGKVVIETASGKQELLAIKPPGESTVEIYTENVLQNYTVQVPHTEKVDGKNVTKMRTETRTRTVPVRRTRKIKLTDEQLAKIKAEREKAEREGRKEDYATTVMVETTYTVNIPQVKTVNGKRTTVVVPATRIRMVPVVRGKTKTERVEASDSYAIDKLKCFSVDGTLIEEEKLKELLSDKSPVILIQSKESISPYFSALLKPDAIFVVQPD